MADLKEFQAEKQTPALSPIQSAMLLEADSYMLTLDSDAWTEHFEKYLKQNQAAGEFFRSDSSKIGRASSRERVL